MLVTRYFEKSDILLVGLQNYKSDKGMERLVKYPKGYSKLYRITSLI